MDIIKSMREKTGKDWFIIPGYSGYIISSDCELFSLKRNKLIHPCKLSRHTGCFYHLIYDKNKERHTVSAARLGYSAINNIDPRDIDANYIVTFKDGTISIRNVVVEDRSIQAMRIRKLQKNNWMPMDKYYDQCIRFCEAARLKDASSLFQIVEENKTEIMRCLNRLFGFRRSEDAYSEIVKYFVVGIMEERLRCSNVISYIFVLAKKFAKAQAYRKSSMEFENRIQIHEM